MAGVLLKEDGAQLLKEDGGAILLGEPAPIVFTYVPPTPTLATVLATHHHPVSRLQFLDDDLVTVLFEISSTDPVVDNRRLLDGSVRLSRSLDSHRSAQVSIANTVAQLFSPRTGDSL